MPKKHVAIMDVGSSKITVLIGQQGVNNSFVIKGKGESNYAGFSDGEFFEPEQLKVSVGEAIKQAQEQAKMKIEALYVGVPAEFCYCDCLEVESAFKRKIKITENEISTLYTKALNTDLMKSKTLVSCSSIWFKLDDGRKIFSAEKQKTTNLRAKVSLVYIENSFVSLFNNVLGQIGIEMVEYMSASVAQINYLLSDFEKQRGSIIIDVGHITTSVIGVLGGGLAGLSAFSLGGGHFSGDFCEAFDLTFDEAEALKKEIVLSVNSKKVGDYEVNIENQVLYVPVVSANEIVCERIEMFASFIKRSLQKISEQNLENTQVYLTGGGLSYINGSREYLEKCLGRDIKILSPNVPVYRKPHYSSSLSVLSEALKKQNKNWLEKLFQ